MKALRNWMSDNEKLREIWAVHEYRQVSATAGDQMRDVILAMTDVMEAVGSMSIVCGTLSCTDDEQCQMCDAWDDMKKAESAATSVIKEVTG